MVVLKNDELIMILEGLRAMGANNDKMASHCKKGSVTEAAYISRANKYRFLGARIDTVRQELVTRVGQTASLIPSGKG